METPVEIEVHGINVLPAIGEVLEGHIGELASGSGLIITSGRIVVTGSAHRHRSGGLYDMRIHRALPDRGEIAVDRIDHGDERYSDIHFASNDTFKRARRLLQAEARRLRGQTKHYEPRPASTIASIDPSGEFGFITTPDIQQICFHRNNVLKGAFDRLEPGVHVTFAE